MSERKCLRESQNAGSSELLVLAKLPAPLLGYLANAGRGVVAVRTSIHDVPASKITVTVRGGAVGRKICWQPGCNWQAG